MSSLRSMKEQNETEPSVQLCPKHKDFILSEAKRSNLDVRQNQWKQTQHTHTHTARLLSHYLSACLSVARSVCLTMSPNLSLSICPSASLYPHSLPPQLSSSALLFLFSSTLFQLLSFSCPPLCDSCVVFVTHLLLLSLSLLFLKKICFV